MSLSPGRRGRAVGVRLRSGLFAAAGAIVLAVGAGGAQAAGGQLDRTFGSGGKVLTDIGTESSDYANAVAIQTDGKIVAAGTTWQGASRSDVALVRYTGGGIADTSFGTGGIVVTDLGGSEDEALAVAIQRDGKIVVAGHSLDGDTSSSVLMRYTAGGALDASFGQGGKVVTAMGGASGVAIQSDGKIVVAGVGWRSGKSKGDLALVRYTARGRPDSSFGSGGKVLTDLGGSDAASAVALQRDGKIVVAGFTGDENMESGRFALVRYTADGRLDASFGLGGKVTTARPQANAIVIQQDGKIVGACDDFALVRYTTRGRPDAGFGRNGRVPPPRRFTWLYPVAFAVTLQADGKIVAAGSSSDENEEGVHFTLARYTTGGKLDPTFGRGGTVVTDLGGLHAEAADGVAIQSGKILAVGNSDQGPGNSDFALARYLP